MSRRLDGKVAVITGAGSGLGKATAELFHDEGAKVVLGDISGNQESVAEALGDGALAVQVDVTRRTEVQALVQAAVDAFGGLDVVANVAGIDGELIAVADVSEESFQRLFDVNLKGPFYAMQAAVPIMAANGGGSIVNVASASAAKAFPMMGAYATSKAALIALTRAFAVENIGHGIRVNAVSPGAIDTPLARALPPAMFDGAVAATPIKRPADPREIAEALLFLASEESAFATASLMFMDGGMSAA